MTKSPLSVWQQHTFNLSSSAGARLDGASSLDELSKRVSPPFTSDRAPSA